MTGDHYCLRREERTRYTIQTGRVASPVIMTSIPHVTERERTDRVLRCSGANARKQRSLDEGSGTGPHRWEVLQPLLCRN
jgi:hypothetical protein